MNAVIIFKLINNNDSKYDLIINKTIKTLINMKLINSK